MTIGGAGCPEMANKTVQYGEEPHWVAKKNTDDYGMGILRVLNAVALAVVREQGRHRLGRIVPVQEALTNVRQWFYILSQSKIPRPLKRKVCGRGELETWKILPGLKAHTQREKHGIDNDLNALELTQYS